jgi:diguanylate cyclase (GGDEF)-like protein/PAS domain S-box-containing protein
LEALYRYEVLDTEPEAAFDRMVALAGKVFGVPMARISLIDHDRQWFKACYGQFVQQTRLDLSFCVYAIRNDEVMVVPDASKDRRFAHLSLVTGEPYIRFYAGAPLKTSNGYNLGTLCLLGTEPNTSFGLAQQEMLAEFAATIVDELELRRASRDLHASETRYRVVAETASDVILTVGEDNCIRYVNGAASKTFGYAPDELLGQNLNLLIPDYLCGLHEAALKRYLQTGERQLHREAIELSGLRKDGREVDLEISFGEYREGGKRLVTGIMRDVTERKQAAALLRATFDATAEGVLSVDEHGRVTHYNQRYVDMWRVPKELADSGNDEALVQHALVQVKEPDGFLERVRAAYQDSEGETKDEFELTDGRIIERVSLPKRMDNRVAGRVWSFREVTAWRRAEQSYKSLTEELEARVAARTAELERVNEQLRHDAFYDSLTGLANRTLFLNRLGLVIERAPRRTKHTFAVLLIDVDRFKVINNSLGRALGDRLLVSLGERLASSLRPGDTVARVGQNEFAVLLEDLKRDDEVEWAVLRIKGEIQKPFLLGDQAIYISVSIGSVLGNSAAYDDVGYGGAEGVLRDAGIAVTHAKALGRARHHVFSAGLRERASILQTLRSDLHGVVERQELSVSYQPIVFLPDSTLSGFEALVRWEHPKFGTVAPSEFIPLAEEAGLIIDIDRWVLREACEQLRRWHHRFPLAPPLAINVNLSSQQFAHPDLVGYVRGILEETGAQPEHLNLEITESVMMQNSRAVTETFAQFKALGVKLYLDDFGTGYSSLSYLQSLPIDSLKIDRSFIHNITVGTERAELVKTILAMAQTLRLNVVAEGVETEAQRARLLALGCAYGQGYLFAQPLATAEASAFLETVYRGDVAQVTRR